MAAGMIEPTVKDPMLKQIKDGIEAQVPPEMKLDFDAIIVSGLKLMYSDQTHQFMQEYLAGVKQRGNDPNIIAHGIVKLATIIHNESKKNEMMPAIHDESKQNEMMPAIFPAAQVLMCYALEDIEKAQGMSFTKEQIAHITKLVTFQLMKAFKITPEMIHKAVKTGMPKPGAAPVAGTPAGGTAPAASPATVPVPQTGGA